MSCQTLLVTDRHNILQEELMAWWCATAKSGNKSPSEEELRTKLEERKMLGM